MANLGKGRIKDMFVGAKYNLFSYARDMRKNPTEAEIVLWKELRNFRKNGFVFRRQHPIEIFIADFYCHKIKLVIEVDGEIHNDDQACEYDESRSGELERFGVQVLRFSNEEILNNLDLVLNKITAKIKELSSSE